MWKYFCTLCTIILNIKFKLLPNLHIPNLNRNVLSHTTALNPYCSQFVLPQIDTTIVSHACTLPHSWQTRNNHWRIVDVVEGRCFHWIWTTSVWLCFTLLQFNQWKLSAYITVLYTDLTIICSHHHVPHLDLLPATGDNNK
jgi:hypothetical protein